MTIVNRTWQELLQKEFSKIYFKTLISYLEKEKNKKKIIFPPENKIFNAFEMTNVLDTKVIILGQDPYHSVNQAHGLSFSVKTENKLPPSLLNVFKELESDLGIMKAKHGNLQKWAKQGVLLLNSILTVESGKPGSHANKGWENFTDEVLIKLSKQQKNLVFILWGKKAQEKTKIINSYEK
jgi:uracil-DNA glycosylase